jgi:hypothetical protein
VDRRVHDAVTRVEDHPRAIRTEQGPVHIGWRVDAVVRPEEAAGIVALRARVGAREAPQQDGGGPFTRASGTNLGRLLERALEERRDRA